MTAVPAPLAEIGVIGLAVMGENLALNVADNDYRVAVWNHTQSKVDKFIERNAGRSDLIGAKSLEDFVASLASPRRVLLMIKAGGPVDEVLSQLTPLLAAGDIVIDGGNSFFRDTERRGMTMQAAGIYFVGMGVSGGEEGARHGPSLMPGGVRAAYDILRPILESISAKTDSGPCVTYVGPGAAGHYVKMIHNGIEYGVMQLIAEAYDLLRRGLALPAEEVAAIFAEWNQGPLESYLVDIAASVLAARDRETGNPLVEMILDRAGQKGTGKWTVESALDLGVPIPTIAAAIDARIMSSLKDERVTASRVIASTTTGQLAGNVGETISAIRDALLGSILCSYAQGMSLLRVASREYAWNVDMRGIARIWKGGCIIRARLLDILMHAFKRVPNLQNLLLDEEVRALMSPAESGWRSTLSAGLAAGIPMPAMTAALAYYDGYRTARLPQNLTQAQRDFFGAHTYERVDRPAAGFVHTDWSSLSDSLIAARGNNRTTTSYQGIMR